MLTENELAWLERRERHEFPFCISCGAVQTAVDGSGYCYPIEECPLEARLTDWQEAAEFESRVAKKLASSDTWDPCKHGYVCPFWTSPDRTCAWCHIRTARLEVEEEMDG